jgi:hypothetical protein
MCRVLKESRSGYYRWLKRKPSRRKLDNQRLDAEIREIYEQSKGRYGSPKITQELRDRGSNRADSILISFSRSTSKVVLYIFLFAISCPTSCRNIGNYKINYNKKKGNSL